MKFTGFNDWIEIFRGGKQIDSAGLEHDGDTVIDTIISKFNPKKHEPPVVIGHPKDNDPAYGWVEKLKSAVKNGVKVLLMKAKNVVPEFEEMVRQELFKKRSISVYPDGSLRHVGFLGAAPPAVKGLADLKFNEDEATTFEFSDDNVDIDNNKKGGDTMDKFKEFIEMLKFWKSVEKDLAGGIADSTPDKGDAGQAYSEADLEKIRKEAEEKGKKEAEAAFAESKKTAATEARKKEIDNYIEQGIKDGKILPAEKDAGLALFMESLDAEAPVQFSEGEKGKKTPLAFFKEHLERYSAMPLFKEYATKGNEGTQFVEAKADEEAAKRIAKHVGVTG